MRTGSKGIALIKKFESLHDGDLKKIGLQPKMDPVGIWTEGWGHAMRDGKGEFIIGIKNIKLASLYATIHTEQQADAALLNDLSMREYGIMQKIKVPLNQNQFDALVSHRFNTGGSSTLYQLINTKAGEEKIRFWFEKKYITADGVVMPGLIKRRKAEADLFFTK